MPNRLKQSLGETGIMIEESAQNYVANHLYTTKGACLSICATFMSSINNMEVPTKQQYLEAAQWIQSDPNRFERIEEMATFAGLRRIRSMKGELYMPSDQLSLSMFLEDFGKRPSFNLFGFLDTQRTKGHALLFYIWGDPGSTDWFLLDPNFGMARWPRVGGLLVGLKKLLESKAYEDFGPYYHFEVWKYEPAA